MKAKIAILFGITSLLVLSFQNCGKLEVAKVGSNLGSSISDNIGSDLGSFKVSLPQSIDSNLLESSEFPISINSKDFNGNIRVELSPDPSSPNYEKLNSGDITYSLSPNTLSMSAGSTNSVYASIQVSDHAHSFDYSDLQLKIYSGNTLLGSTKTSLKVNPLLYVRMYGRQDSKEQKWSVKSDLNLRTHFPDIKIRFVNYDTRSNHIVHGSGAIPHGSTSSPQLAATSANSPGGVYEVKILPTQTNNGSFYYHNLGDSADRYFVSINTDRAELDLKLVSQAQAPVRKPNSTEEESCH